DLAHFDAPSGEVRTRGLDVAYDELKTLNGAWLHRSETRPERDRARGARRRELDESELLRDLVVVVGIEPDLVDVERLRAIDVRDRNLHELESILHGADPISGS